MPMADLMWKTSSRRTSCCFTSSAGIGKAFAAVTMAAMAEFELPHEIVNVHGGACALGHPIGASGARIVVTLLGALRKQGKKKGVAALCIGGGEATALAVEML